MAGRVGESLESADQKKKADDNSSNGNQNHIVQCLELSLERTKLILQNHKLEEINNWNVKTINVCFDKYCNRSIAETANERGSDESDNPYKVLNQNFITDLMQDNDINLISATLEMIKSLLSEHPDLAYEDIEQANLMSRFYQLLNWNHQPTIQYDVTCLLESLYSSHQALDRKRTLIRKLIINLRNLNDTSAISKTLLILLREVSLGGESRDQVLGSGLVAAFPVLVRNKNSSEYLEKILDISSAFCDTLNPLPNITVIAQLLPTLYFFIEHDYLVETLHTITNISRGGPTYCQLIIDSGLLDKIVPLACDQDNVLSYSKMVFLILENIATGSEAQKIALLDSGVMIILRFALLKENEYLLPHALSFLKRFVGKDCKLLRAVVCSEFFPVIVNSVKDRSFSELRREAAVTLTNFFMVGREEQLMAMADRGAISALCGLLNSDEFVLMAIKAIQSYADNCPEERIDVLITQMKKLGAHEKIRSLYEVSGNLNEFF